MVTGVKRGKDCDGRLDNLIPKISELFGRFWSPSLPARVGVGNVSELLWAKARYPRERDLPAPCVKRVANSEKPRVVDADDVAGVGGLDDLSILTKEGLGGGEGVCLAWLWRIESR